MTKVSRLAALGALLALIAWMSSPNTQGEPAAKKLVTNPVAPRVKASEPVAEAALAESKFATGGVITYRTLAGENLFALQIQPKLDPVPVRSRDYLIMVSTAASQAGDPWIAANQIADAIVQTAGDNDRVSIYAVGAPKTTQCLTKDFLYPKDMGERHKLDTVLKDLKNKKYPVGDTDLKDALQRAIAEFNGKEKQQRIILFLGDGQSTHDPLSAADRDDLAKAMVKRKIAFFPVPLGGFINAENLHGLATGTGGFVLRTRVAEEKLPEALKRYQEAFAAPILYQPGLTLAGDVAEVYPQELPPLRPDAPTLVVGRLKGHVRALDYSVTGLVNGQEQTLKAVEAVPAADLDNYFLVNMVNQWQKAKTQPALIRADRALALAYEQTRLHREDLLVGAQLAAEKKEFAAAQALYEAVLTIAPHDSEAKAGAEVVAKLKTGNLTVDMIKEQLNKSQQKADKIEKVNGAIKWNQTNLTVLLAQLDKEKEKDAAQPAVGGLGDDLLQAQRDRQIVEEQKMTQTVDAAIRQARRDVTSDPEGVLRMLNDTLARVKDHPDLNERTRDALSQRLQTSLRESAITGRQIQQRKQEQQLNQRILDLELNREVARKTLEERTEGQYRVYKNLLNVARFEEKTKQDVLMGLQAMLEESLQKGTQPPVSAQAAYNQVLASYNLQQYNQLQRIRAEKHLAVMLAIEKSHIPYPDEPGIFFPPLATWKAIHKTRKDKYEVSSLPDDPKGREEANAIYKLLEENIDTAPFQQQMTLKEFLGLLYEKLGQQGKELPIVIDTAAFKEDNPDAEDIYDTPIQFEKFPKKLTIATALRLALSKVKTNDATYLIRRSFIEITTNNRMIKDRVLRVYPVGDLVIPISQTGGVFGSYTTGGFGGGGGGFNGVFGQFGGGQFGGGQFGGGQFGQFGGGQFGFGGGQFGQFGGGQFGQFGGGQFGQFGGGQFGQFGGGQFGQFGGGQFGGGQFGFGGGNFGFGGGQFGFGGGQFGGGQFGFQSGVSGGGGLSFQGGSFQGGFNGSLGQFGASQAIGLIDVVTRVVAPGEWFVVQQPSPFQMMNPFANFGAFGMGMMGMGGVMGGQAFGMMGMGGGLPPPVSQGGPVDIRDANTVEFFPPALALIVRGPSRIHYSITGGIIGGKVKRAEAAWLEAEQRGLAMVQPGGKLKVAAGQGGELKVDPKGFEIAKKINKKTKEGDLDPAKVWQEELAKGGVDAGMVIATADFLFECGKFDHAVEFLKANLRHGIVVRPWVYEALAVALEATNAPPEEVQRARLSAVALDPTDAQGFLEGARTMAQNKQFDRALAFCRQAALLEPNLAKPYADALVYADLAKDSSTMEWAVGKLLGQDWPADNARLQNEVVNRVKALSQNLRQENRVAEADKLQAALKNLRQRDLVITLSWEASLTDPAELELLVTEPCGAVCSATQKQTPGGGSLISSALTENKIIYTAAQAFPGDYEIKVRRTWGQPLGGRARVEMVRNLGTPQETRQIEVIRLDQGNLVKVNLGQGRRTELAAIAPPQAPKDQQDAAKEERLKTAGNVLALLREYAHPDFSGASPRGGAGTPGARRPLPSTLAGKGKEPAPVAQSAVGTVQGTGVNLTSQVRVSADQRELEMVIRPYFQNTSGLKGGAGVNLPLIPGAASR